MNCYEKIIRHYDRQRVKKFLKAKWKYGVCRHFCCLCKFRGKADCFNEIVEDYDSIKYYVNKKEKGWY